MNAPAKEPEPSPAAITRRSKSSFRVSFLFLDRRQRQAMNSIYAFCRVVDDIVDDATGGAEVARAALQGWRDELALVYQEGGAPATAIGRGLQTAVGDFAVRQSDLMDVVQGVEQDLDPGSPQTFEDLDKYCDLVASAVGLACLPVLGGDPQRDRAYAVALGRALQLTNILRDLAVDAERGRIYVPFDQLLACGLGGEPELHLEWLSGKGPPRVYAEDCPVHKVVEVLADRAETYYEQSLQAYPSEAGPGLLVAEVMAAVYRDLLQKLRASKGAVPRLGEALRVSASRKLFLALRTRWRGRR